MQTLTMALLAEGSTDERFLPPLIQRVIADLIYGHGRQEFDVLPPRVLKITADKQIDKILEAARKAYGSHLLFIHVDADNETAERAFVERIEPGIHLVDRVSGEEKLCRDIVPIVPIYMTEAWMLADADTLLTEIGTDLSKKELNIPQKSEQIEGLADPKARLNEIISAIMASRSRRRRRFDVGSLFAPMGQTIDLVKLERLSAYQRFVGDLHQTLIRLGVLPPNSA